MQYNKKNIIDERIFKMFLMYVLGFFITYIGLVIFNKDSLIGRDITDSIDLYIIMLVLSSVFPITLTLALVIFATQRILDFFKGRKKNEKV